MDSAGIWKNVLIGTLGTVAGGLILTALSWTFGVHHAAGAWIVSVAGSIGRALVFPIPVPVYVIALSVGTFFVLLWFARRIRRPKVALAASDTRDTPLEALRLTDNETAMIRLLARADGEWMTVAELARHAGLANLVAEQALDQLSARDFVEVVADAYCLSPGGRDYVIAKGYVPHPIPAASRRALRY